MGNKYSSDQPSSVRGTTQEIKSMAVSYMRGGGRFGSPARAWVIPIPGTDRYFQLLPSKFAENFSPEQDRTPYEGHYLRIPPHRRHISPLGQHFTSISGCLGTEIYPVERQPTALVDEKTMALIKQTYEKCMAEGERESACGPSDEVYFNWTDETYNCHLSLLDVLAKQFPLVIGPTSAEKSVKSTWNSDTDTLTLWEFYEKYQKKD